ncbi:MAG: hypothetical protein NTZ55_04785 [Candidatus Roizmanbacteria bacterium]|nr:hypothetical protein [Candidatus Roizmanbacteria bacterium]
MIDKSSTSIFISYFKYRIEFIIPASNRKWEKQIISIFQKNFGGYIDSITSQIKSDVRVKFVAKGDEVVLGSNIFNYVVPTMGSSLDRKKFGQLLKEIIIVTMLSINKKKSSVCLHASSVSYGKKAVLFLGNSGSGKSTICQLLTPQFAQLTDDATFLINLPICQTSPLPIFEKKVPLRLRTSSLYTVGALCFLKKSTTNHIIKLEKDMDIFNQLINSMFHTGSISEISALQDLLKSSVPIYRIEFRKDKTIGRLLEQLL